MRGQGIAPTRRRALAALAAALAVPAAAQGRDLLVFAAASLKTALDEVADRYRRETGRRPVLSYAASPALARQIESGAPADLFVAADLDWMDYLARRRLVRTETRRNLLGNRIVLIAPASSPVGLEIAPGFPLAAALGGGRLAMAETTAVPAGRYGRAALEALGVWESVRGRLIQAENTRAALLLVARGEAPLGIVYRTDAAAEPAVRVVGPFAATTHPPIVYPVAITAASTHPDAVAFLAYLGSAAARPLFERQGFLVPE